MQHQISCFLHDKMCSRVLWWSHWPCWNCIVSLRLHPVISVYSQYLIWTWGITYPPTASPIAYATNSISHLQDGSIVLQCPPGPFSFSASHSMYGQFILLRGFVFSATFTVMPTAKNEQQAVTLHLRFQGKKVLISPCEILLTLITLKTSESTYFRKTLFLF